MAIFYSVIFQNELFQWPPNNVDEFYGTTQNLVRKTLIDSTPITIGKTRLPWALFHGERAGIKLHVALAAATEQPVQVIETIGTAHDGPIGEHLVNKAYILVHDRAYGKTNDLINMPGISSIL